MIGAIAPIMWPYVIPFISTLVVLFFVDRETSRTVCIRTKEDKK
jgi:hypothetical protein